MQYGKVEFEGEQWNYSGKTTEHMGRNMVVLQHVDGRTTNAYPHTVISLEGTTEEIEERRKQLVETLEYNRKALAADLAA